MQFENYELFALSVGLALLAYGVGVLAYMRFDDQRREIADEIMPAE